MIPQYHKFIATLTENKLFRDSDVNCSIKKKQLTFYTTESTQTNIHLLQKSNIIPEITVDTEDGSYIQYECIPVFPVVY